MKRTINPRREPHTVVRGSPRSSATERRELFWICGIRVSSPFSRYTCIGNTARKSTVKELNKINVHIRCARHDLSLDELKTKFITLLMTRSLPGIPGAFSHLRTSLSRCCKIRNSIVTTAESKTTTARSITTACMGGNGFDDVLPLGSLQFTLTERFPPDQRKQNADGFAS